VSKVSKHFHLTLHFTVTGDDSRIPTTGVKFQRHPNDTRSGDDEGWRKHDDRMRRLYKAVLSNKRVLRDFLESRISSWLTDEHYWDEILLNEEVIDERGEARVEDILRPAIATLSEEDREIFTRQIAADVFYENSEEFLDCFSTEFDAVELHEVEMRQEP